MSAFYIECHFFSFNCDLCHGEKQKAVFSVLLQLQLKGFGLKMRIRVRMDGCSGQMNFVFEGTEFITASLSRLPSGGSDERPR